MKQSTITTDEILGNEVLDPDGVLIGVALKLHLNPDQNNILGMTVDQGFGKPSLYVGTSHIKQFGKDVILLGTRPVPTLQGKKVYKEDGTYLGKVVDVHRVKGQSQTFTAEKDGVETTLTKSRVKTNGDIVVVST